MKNIATTIGTFILAIALTGCAPSAQEVDANQVQSQKNAEYNLLNYIRSEVDNAISWNIQSDSTISQDCPYGDGWASGTIKTGTGDLKAKCQTTGSGKGIGGCLDIADFNKKAYAQQEGSCDNSLSFMPVLNKN